MRVILKAEHIAKQYRLGLVGRSSLHDDMVRVLARLRGQEDPFLKVNETVKDPKSKSNYVWALEDINFEVREGEVLGIIGKNGAGKSTLLKILSRVTAPTLGTIKSRGRIASLLEVGTGFNPELTGRENVYLNGAILGMSRAEISSKLDAIIDFSGCEQYIDTPTKRYSSGMTVRLAFAVAAHLEPEILVVDEVLAVGDAEFQKKAIGKMQDISRGEGRTVLFVSHNMASVRSLCTKAIILDKGKISYEGDTAEAINYYIDNNDKSLLLDKVYVANDKSNYIQQIEIPQNLIVSGEILEFKVKLNINRVKKANIHFGIYDLNDDKISHLSSEYSNEGFLNNGKNECICRIEKLSLPKGKYYLNVGLMAENLVVEEIKNCVSFTVENGDYFNCGHDVRHSALKGKILIDHEWK